MCDCECDTNTTATVPFEGTYSMANLGTGEEIYFGENVTSTNVEFQVKSLVAGANVTLTHTDDEITITSAGPDGGVTILSNNGGGQPVGQNITGATLNLRTLVAGTNISMATGPTTITINNTLTPVTSVTNLGTGEPILVDILAGSVRARSLLGVNGLAVNNLGNEVQLSDEQVQTKTAVISYNYGQLQSPVDLSVAYNSPSGVVSNTVPACENTAGLVTVTGLTTVDYQPGARSDQPLVLPFETLANNGTTANSEIKLYPNTTGANDYLNDYLLYTNSAGEIWQLNAKSIDQRLMVDYNGNPLPFTAQFIAMDIADNLLFYVRNPSDNFILYYDFATGVTDKVIEFTAYGTWSGTFVNMYFDQDAKVLYLLSSDYKYLRISVKPFNRVISTTNIPMGMPSMVANIPASAVTQYAFCIDNGSKVQYLVGDAGSQTKLWQISNPLGSIPFDATYANDLESVSNGYAVEFGASGRLYIGSQDSKRLYRFEIGQDILSSPTYVMDLFSSPLCITRSPYGITF